MVSLLLSWAFVFAMPSSATAQSFTYNPRPPRPVTTRPANDNQMLVQAGEVDYDYNNSRVSAVGNVQLFYNGTSVEADKVIYDQKTKRLHAEGNIRMTDVDGKITYANILDLSDDYRDGFVDSLRVDTADATRMAATRADRTSGNYTVFENGVYTACAPCKDDPKRPPLWQVKGMRIIHDQIDKMLYFENAQLEFFGVPLAYLPYFSAPDPTVKRKSGFLAPNISSSIYGFGVEVPYYWAIAPDYDATFNPRITTQQGVLFQGEFRQRLMDGAYQIRAYGIDQLDPGAFAGQPGDRQFRGGVESKGEFALNDKWVWGWEGVALTDYTLLSDYRLSVYKDTFNSFLNLPTEAPSQLFITGVGNRSYFDARTIYYLSLSGNQSQVPVVWPVVDYSNVINHSVLGGEVSYKTNFTNLTRESAVFDAINPVAAANGACLSNSADTAQSITRQNCLLRGLPGTYTRFSGEADWRRSFTDSAGEIWTPFASVRADAINADISNQPGVSNFLPVGDTQALRVMPTVGLEYRYPFINVQPWGTTTVEPIAQVIIRPNESYAGKLPNEDSQSMAFDTTNLFSVDKFSGYDRVEGGGRANAGVQATTQFDRGGSVTAVFGQSYQLFGLNSFAVRDVTNTAVDSGLQTPKSDYVASLSYSPNRTYTLATRARFDEATGNIQRFEAEARANFDRWSVGILYGDYAAQPDIGYLTRRDGLLVNGSVKITSNWVATGAARWDLVANQINQYVVGAGYVDDCFVLAANYVTSFSYATATSPPILGHAFMFQIGLRTLANTTN
ncbi:MAG TPA: LPS-assembly protein LptD [Bradyrhizobium sp.]|nr:LPS-assembly protein LptD [Bradyrhizobium sp.]